MSLTKAVASLCLTSVPMSPNGLIAGITDTAADRYAHQIIWSLRDLFAAPGLYGHGWGRRPEPKSLLSGQAWLAGGCLRDWMMNRKPVDVDLWTTVSWERLSPLFRDRGWHEVGQHFYSDTQQVHKMVKWCRKWEMLLMDVVYGVESPDKTILGFDYTINAIAYDIGAERLIMHDQWQEHIDKRLLVRVDPSNMDLFISQARIDRLAKLGFVEEENEKRRRIRDAEGLF